MGQGHSRDELGIVEKTVTVIGTGESRRAGSASSAAERLPGFEIASARRQLIGQPGAATFTTPPAL